MCCIYTGIARERKLCVLWKSLSLYICMHDSLLLDMCSATKFGNSPNGDTKFYINYEYLYYIVRFVHED